MGLIVGSFLNVLIHRLPLDESIVKPCSYCPSCAKPIAWYDNIPVLSFILLAGHCRKCKHWISWRYPLVEIMSGFIWSGSWYATHGTPLCWISIIFLSLLLVGTLTDFETGLIPDPITLGGTVVGLISSFFYPPLHQATTEASSLIESSIGLLVGGGMIYLTGLAGNWIFQRELMQKGLEQSMGGGDVKLMAMIGSFLGWQKALLIFFTAPFLGLPFALYQRLAKKEAIIPYGPFLSVAAVIHFLMGDLFWKYFLRL